MSYLDHQEVTMSHSGPPYRCVHPYLESPLWEGVKPSKSTPHMGVRLYLVGFDIKPIEARHEKSNGLSRSSRGDNTELWSHLLVRT